MGILTPEDLEKLSKTPTLKESDNPLGYERIEPNPAICCVCKQPNAAFATLEPPPGYRWGGWFCGGCVVQGQVAANEGFIIDQFTKEIQRTFNHPVNRIVFNKDGEVVEV